MSEQETPDELGLTTEDRITCAKVLLKENPHTLLKLLKIILINSCNLPIEIKSFGVLPNF